MNILLLSLEGWPTCARHPKALKEAGFTVFVAAAEKDPIFLSRYIDQRIAFKAGTEAVQQVAGLITKLANKIDFILGVDEKTVRLLTDLHKALPDGPAKELIRKSKGDPAQYEEVSNKAKTLQRASNAKIPTPGEQVFESVEQATDIIKDYGYPIVAKAEYGTAGRGVRICKDKNELNKAFMDFKGPLLLQRYIDSTPCMANVAAYEGEVLACALFKKIECYPDAKGPSSVVELFDHKAMQKAAETFVKATGYTGILSLDFMVQDKKAYLIECNPRPSPVTHLGAVTGIDLYKALFCKLSRKIFKNQKAKAKIIALFPKELSRDFTSPYLYEAYHDVPWDQPEIVQYLLRTVKAV